VRVEDCDGTTACALACRDQVAGCIVTDVDFVFAQQRLDVARAFLFVFRRRVDLGDGNPFAQDRVAGFVDVFESGFHARIVLNCFDLVGGRRRLRRGANTQDQQCQQN